MDVRDLPVGPERLAILAAMAVRVKAAARAAARTPRPGASPIRYLARARTSDREGSRDYQPGDAIGTVIWREMAIRGKAVVRTYRDLSEVQVRIALDSARSLLGPGQPGRFAVQLGAALAASSLAGRHPTQVALLRESGTALSPRASRPLGLAPILRFLDSAGPEGVSGPSLVGRLAVALAPPRANLNFFGVLPPWYPLASLEPAFALLRGRCEAATIFLVAAAGDLESADDIATDPETGRRVELGLPAGLLLARGLDAAVLCGRSLGVRVEPLIVTDSDPDIESYLDHLTWL